MVTENIRSKCPLYSGWEYQINKSYLWLLKPGLQLRGRRIAQMPHNRRLKRGQWAFVTKFTTAPCVKDNIRLESWVLFAVHTSFKEYATHWLCRQCVQQPDLPAEVRYVGPKGTVTASYCNHKITHSVIWTTLCSWWEFENEKQKKKLWCSCSLSPAQNLRYDYGIRAVVNRNKLGTLLRTHSE